MNLSLGFSINQHFLDPKVTSDGKPYGPWKYKRIVEECYFISHQIHTSYADVLKITPRERLYMMEFLTKEAEALQKAREENQKKMEQKVEELKSSGKKQSMKKY